ncbi:ISWI one complex protein 4 [Candida viswanathii]|uniref:ISWI one complex protein 4 n=1 Tax=Candida viswanathii TaxID=5486 RepID=A0A367YI65_9ASCO|nr:ISWI one complex protein 4 [Candida viswanathii]
MSFPPTTIVLAKVKGYPPWPAMVLDETLLPAHILSKQPKSKTPTSANPNTVKKVVPVRFFSDDTYIWINTNDMKELSKEDISKYISSSAQKRRKDNLLEQAYELANDPPDMQQFILYGSKGVPPEPETTSEDDEVLSIPAKKKQKQQQQKQAASPKKKKESPKPKPKATPKPKPKPEPVVEYDDDWGLDEFNKYDKALGNFIYDTEEEQTKVFSKVTYRV